MKVTTVLILLFFISSIVNSKELTEYKGEVITLDKASIEITKLPISGINRMKFQDGRVIYMSSDNRYVFDGVMIDKWTNSDAAELVFNEGEKIDWAETGINSQKVAIHLGSEKKSYTLFVSPECADCSRFFNKMKGTNILETEGIDVVLVSSTRKGASINEAIWCSKEKPLRLLSYFTEGNMRMNAEHNTLCRKTDLLLADTAARLFKVAKLPALYDPQGKRVDGEIIDLIVYLEKNT